MRRGKGLFKKRLTVLALCACLLFPGLPGSADSLSEIEGAIGDAEERIAELEGQRSELDSRLQTLKDDEDQIVAYQETLQGKIDNLEEQIEVARDRIVQLDQEILVLEAKIQRAQEEIEETLRIFQDNLKTMYKSGAGSPLGTLEIFLNSDSLYEFAMMNEMLEGATAYNQQIVDQIDAYLERTETERKASEEKKEEVAALKNNLERNQEELQGLYLENEKVWDEIRANQLAVTELIAENESESVDLIAYYEEKIAEKAAEEAAIAEAEAAAEAERQRAAAEAQNKGGSGGGGGGGGESSPSPAPESGSSGGGGGYGPSAFQGSFTWPIPGVYYVTQYYGENGHNGMDIAGPSGTPIVAAEAGEVLIANNYDSWGDSWGYYVLLYHNGTYTTRYAHLSSLAVSDGQQVAKGQVVGYEGTTGNSTGPHLHFEVYRNGTRTDPYPYIS